MSEAARHQAMPQPALFSPASTHNGKRGNSHGGNASRPSGNNPNSVHRSGGRGR